MATELDGDYVKRLEAALFEYVEKYGITSAVRDLFKDAPPNFELNQNPRTQAVTKAS